MVDRIGKASIAVVAADDHVRIAVRRDLPEVEGG